MKKVILITIVTAMLLTTTACGAMRRRIKEETSQKTGTIEFTTEAPTEEITTEEPTQAKIEAIKPGNYVEHDNLKFSFEKASQYDEIGEEFFVNKPEDGKKYLVLFFEVENISNEDKYVSVYDCEAYLDDYSIDQTILLTDVDGYESLNSDIAPGKKAKGYFCYEVNSDWQKFELTYTDGIFSTDPTYEFVVTPDDLS